MIFFINNCHGQSSNPRFVILLTLAMHDWLSVSITGMYRIWTVLYSTEVSASPGKSLSDVGIPEISIGGSEHLQYSAYTIKRKRVPSQEKRPYWNPKSKWIYGLRLLTQPNKQKLTFQY